MKEKQPNQRKLKKAIQEVKDMEGIMRRIARQHFDLKDEDDEEIDPSSVFVSLDEAVDESYLTDWYINSVSSDEAPVWTEEHISELVNDFIVIPRGEF